jgi:bifunctional DNA-binding transcriptional regulator/antitoxin component of YhaV-PrlF toxin-antitoxin module
VTQGITPGWGNVYTWDTPDQFIDVSHVPSGTYWVVEETIPAGGHLPHRLSGDRTRAPEHPIPRNRGRPTPPYNDQRNRYNDIVSQTSYVMTMSRNGQVSIPADTRARWSTRQVLVVDLGDRVVMRPLGDQPLQELRGKYSGRGPRTDRARHDARREEAEPAKSRPS